MTRPAPTLEVAPARGDGSARAPGASLEASLEGHVWAPGPACTPEAVGGKAAGLAALPPDVPVPAWVVVRATAWADGRLAPDAWASLAPALDALGGGPFAVRSSAPGEDGAASSFAGQFASFLDVAAADVPARIADVWASADAAHVAAYRAARAPGAPAMRPAVVVQRMLAPRVAGVAFSADPVSGRRRVAVVAAVAGRADGLVSGAVEGETVHVDAAGRVTARQGPASGLTDADAARVAALARRLERAFGRAQDIEWAIEDGTLYALQSRPVTTLAALADPDARPGLWDNANIAESYRGVVAPLTFGFARTAYAHVYRAWLRQTGVPEAALDVHADAFRRLIGRHDGRVYYHLPSWYALLALLPGVGATRGFMETMMGVRDGLPDGLLPETPRPRGRARARETLRLVGTGVRLAVTWATMARRVRAFTATLDAALALPDLDTLTLDGLAAHYRRLEDDLLPRWGTPLANDTGAMVAFGLTRRLAARWAPAVPALAERLATPHGGVVSAEPPALAARLAALVRPDAPIVETLLHAPAATALAALRRHPAASDAFDAYVARFGDRCLDELKLESPTLADDPLPLLRTVGALAARPAPGPPAPPPTPGALVAGVAGGLRRRALRAVGAWARASVRHRENLRFERTRVFGTARRLLRAMGARLAAEGALDAADDVFFLTPDEVLATVDGTGWTDDLRGLVALRRAEHARHLARPAPPERFVTRGSPSLSPRLVPPAAPAPGLPTQDGEPGAETRLALGGGPGSVEGRVRVVVDPREATMLPGEILVAERTDPGWVTLFAAASGLVVERGSLLSHAAIVAREMGLPAIVGLAGATEWLRTGDRVRLDGASGTVTRLARTDAPDVSSPDVSSPDVSSPDVPSPDAARPRTSLAASAR